MGSTPESSKKRVVLVVDDEPDIVSAICEQLEHNGLTAVGFSDSQEAFEWGRANTFDLLISDLKMRKIPGLLLHENLKLYYPELITILITAHHSFDSAQQAVASDVYVYLTKPFSMDELMGHVNRAIEKKDLLDRNAHLVEEQQQLIEKLLVANRELRKLDHMKSDFVANVSHELRTPLTSIRNIAYNLEHDVAEPLQARQREYMKLIEEDVVRLSALINDILDLSRLESGKEELVLSKFPLLEGVQAALKSMEAACRAKQIELGLETGAGAEGLQVEVDRGKMEQLLVNLISNAVKYSEPGKKVTVTVTREGEKFRIAVRDEGIGILREDLARIFDRFEQLGKMVRGGTKGTGLGLSIVKRIVELHEGQVRVESEPGKGSTFIVDLPIQYTRV